jgi:two-component system, cell cycle sensor histidine kinase and response regulator CckA
VVKSPAERSSPAARPQLLVVDDEPSLVGLLRRYLERLGYAVDVAATAEAALELFQSEPAKYACILTDLKLPGMSGDELLVRMRSLRPDLRAVVSSGRPYEPQSPRTGFVQKPYLPAMLSKELERILRAK